MKTINVDITSNLVLFNVGNTKKVTFTQDGYMIQYDVPIARVGEFNYTADELGLEGVPYDQNFKFHRGEESFNQEVINSLNDKLLTNDHPEGGVNSGNAKTSFSGTISNGYFKDGVLYAGKIIVYDQKTIEDIKVYNKKEVSIGFRASYSFNKPVVDNVQYDGIEKIHYINHLALCNRGKAGSQFRMHSNKKEVIPMETEVLVDVDFEGKIIKVPQSTANIINSHKSDKLSESINSMTTLLDSINKRLEAVENMQKSDSLQDKGDDLEPKKSDGRAGASKPVKADPINKEDEEDSAKDGKEDCKPAMNSQEMLNAIEELLNKTNNSNNNDVKGQLSSILGINSKPQAVTKTEDDLVFNGDFPRKIVNLYDTYVK